MTDEDVLELVDYSDYFGDIRRVSHAVQDLEPPPSLEELSHGTVIDAQNFRAKIDRQIRLRKRIMAGLDVEIEELRKEKKKLE